MATDDTMMNGEIPKKRCTGPCGQEYDATAKYFYQAKHHKDGLRSQCKECMGKKQYIYDKERKNRPEVKEHIRTYSINRMKNPEQRKQKQAKDREYYKTNYKNHDFHAKWRARAKIYRDTNESPEQRRVWKRNRDARRRSVNGTHTSEQIQAQLKRQKHRCYYGACGHAKFKKIKGKYQYHIEHTFPLSRVAGSDIPANSIDYLVLSCPTCNLSKGDKFPWEWPEGGRLL